MAKSFHLADLFETVAATTPDRLAVVSDSLSLNFRELNARADRVASGLAERGVGRGDAVGLYLMNRAEFIEAFVAAVKLGAVPFNVNYRYEGDELAYLFDNAKAAAIIHGAEFGPKVAALAPGLPSLKVSVSVEDGSGVSTPSSASYAALLESEPRGPWERSQDDILLTYTGGTTGMPKGVMWPHKAFVFACAGGAGYFNPLGPMKEPGDIASRAEAGYPLRLFPLAPLMHAAAIWSAWSALLNGVTVVLDEGRSFDPVRLWDKVEREHVNIVQVVGDAMAIPLRDALANNPGRWSLTSLRHFGSGGAVFSKHVQDDLRNLLPKAAQLSDGMGSSETGISGQAAESKEGVMRLCANETQAVVIDDRLARAGETGLVARSGHTPVGYFGDEKKTAETFRTIDGRLWAVSGDTARLDDDGMITVFGRGSTSINSGGEKIFPEEVEEALRAHPSIRDAVVVGRADPRWGESVVGVVSSRTPQPPSIDEVRAFLTGRLAGYKIPKALVLVDEVKRSAAGKQDYRWAKDVATGAS